MNFVQIFIGAMIIENVVLTKFLGLCPFLGVSKDKKSAVGMGFAVTFVMFISSILSFFLNKVLVSLDIEYMDLVLYILIIASFVQLVELFLKVKIPALYKSLGIFLPLITTNCAVLYVALTTAKMLSFSEVVVYALGVPAGFMLVLFIFSSTRQKLQSANVPKYFKGNPIALITAGLMAIAFGGLAGLV
ncbi:MAG: electron transport complex subunit RsxA [Erysipelothrix sp.]|nr:electron transport complex subunit RsxA [Erysipelothrix sp.]